MKNTFEKPLFLYVTIKGDDTNRRIVTYSADAMDVVTMEERGATILKSRQDWEALCQQYEDIAIDRGMQFYPELNSYFSYLITLLVNEDNQPQNVEIIVSASLLTRKENI